MNLQELEQIVDDNIKENNAQEITEGVLNMVLKQIIAYFAQKNNVLIFNNTGAGAVFYNQTNELIIAIAVKASAAGEFINIGTTANGVELVEGYELQANKWTVISLNHLSSVNEQIFISNVTNPSQIRVYKN